MARNEKRSKKEKGDGSAAEMPTAPNSKKSHSDSTKSSVDAIMKAISIPKSRMTK
jgi:hypothetical protein